MCIRDRSIVNVKDELNIAINEKLNRVTEHIVIAKDLNSDIDLELFNCENRGVHPMQFLNRVREFNQFCRSSWEIQLLKIMKCFRGNSAVWAEVHKVDWVNYQCFEMAFRKKYRSEEEQEILRSKIMGPGNFGTQRCV